MNTIQMVDLYGQYLHIKPEIDEAIASVIENSEFINGSGTNQFCTDLARFLNTNHVISCANGTDALFAALHALGMNENAEVIVPSFTFVAPVEMIKMAGLKPVFADVDPHTFTIDPAIAESLINKNTKAIIPVHLFGQAADMKAIREMASNYNLNIIEDTAQAIGCRYNLNDKRQMAGTIGDIGTTSFFPSKNLSCFGDGGAIFTNDDNLAKKLKKFVNHGMAEKYHYDTIGMNSRLDTIQAVILKTKLKYLEKYNNARRGAAQKYTALLKNTDEIICPVTHPSSDHVYHQYTIRVLNGQRDDLKAYLQQHHIPSMIYYPIPLHVQKPYMDERVKLPVTEKLCNEVLSLPMHTELDDNQIDYITSTILKFFRHS